MNIKLLFQKYLKEFSLIKSRVSLRREARVYTHWKIISADFCVAFLAVLYFSFSVYLKINRGEFLIVKAEKTAQREILSDELLVKVIVNFDDKRIIFNQIKKGGLSSVDPSL